MINTFQSINIGLNNKLRRSRRSMRSRRALALPKLGESASL